MNPSYHYNWILRPLKAAAGFAMVCLSVLEENVITLPFR